jgi:hypothetical protein
MRRQFDLVQIALYLMNQKGKKGSHGGYGVAEDLLPIPVKQMFSVYDPQIARKTEDKIEKGRTYRIQNSELKLRTPNSEPRTPNSKPNGERRTVNSEQQTSVPTVTSVR